MKRLNRPVQGRARANSILKLIGRLAIGKSYKDTATLVGEIKPFKSSIWESIDGERRALFLVVFFLIWLEDMERPQKYHNKGKRKTLKHVVLSLNTTSCFLPNINNILDLLTQRT